MLTAKFQILADNCLFRALSILKSPFELLPVSLLLYWVWLTEQLTEPSTEISRTRCILCILQTWHGLGIWPFGPELVDRFLTQIVFSAEYRL